MIKKTTQNMTIIKYLLLICFILAAGMMTFFKYKNNQAQIALETEAQLIERIDPKLLNYNSHKSSNPTPIITNFRVSDSEPDKVYFDTPMGKVSGLSIDGFVISGKEILEINTKKKFFKVSTPFTSWDNNTIRLEGGNGVIYDFTLEYIDNQMLTSNLKGKEYFVATTGNDLNDGLNDNSAFKTLNFAMTKVVAGDKIWVKAGNYGKEMVKVSHKATELLPIEIEGYKDKPGDISSLYLTYNGNDLDKKEMPLFDGSNSNQNTFFDLTNADFYIVKNIQAQNYENGFYSTKSVDNVQLERIILNNIGNGSKHYSGFAMAGVYNGDSDNWRVNESIIINAKAEALAFYGSHNLATDVQVYSNDNNEKYSGTDYYVILKGSNNIVLNSLAQRTGVKHRGHGFGTKSTKIICEYNLIDNCKAKGITLESYFFAHSKSKYNVAKNSLSIGETSMKNGGSQHLMIRDGASNNTFENIHCEKGQSGVSIEHTGENSETTFGNNNKWINCSFKEMKWCFGITDDSSITDVYTGNQIMNCTFIDTNALWRNIGNGDDSNRMINCIILNSSDSKIGWNQGGSMNWSFDYNCFYKTRWKDPTGEGNISVDPRFIDEKNNNFIPQNKALLSAPKLTEVNYSASKKERTNLTTIGCEIHAEEVPLK